MTSSHPSNASASKICQNELLVHTLEQILAAGDLAIAYAWMTYRVRKNGRTGKFPLAEVYRFRGGKVIEWRVHYFDASTVAEALTAD